MSMSPPERFKAYLERARDLDSARQTAEPFSTGPEPDEITLKDDGFHWPLYASHSHPFWFVEWWYFAFEDKAKGLTGIVAIGVFNPGDVDHLGAASCFTAVMDRNSGEITTKMDVFELEEFVASYTRADVSCGTNTNRAIDEDHYQLDVTSKDGELALSFEYERAHGIPPHWMGYEITGTARPWEVSSWLAWMPSARVKGRLRLGTEAIEIDGTGYHDHNWAVWLFPASTWQWAMFNRPTDDPETTLAFDFATQESFGFSQAYFQLGDLEIDFPEVEIEPGEWERWHVAWQYPTSANFSATATGSDGNEYRLVLFWQAKLAAPLWKCPMIIFEQAADFRGTLYRRDPEAGWVPVEEIEETGFYEYTAKWL